MWGVDEMLKPHNVLIDCVMLLSALIYLIGAKTAGSVKWNCSPG